MGSERLSGKVIKPYLEKFPNVASLTLAKKIYRENKEVFNSIDTVRANIRRYRGKIGKKNRDQIKDKTFINQKPKLPEPVTESKITYQIPTCNKRILIISDLHVPYHDNDALEAALKYGKKKKVDTILINGDLIDFYQLSRFEKDIRVRNAAFEIKEAKEVLEYIRYKFPNALIIWYMGNHDHRFTKYMVNKAPELLDIPEFSLYHIMELARLNIILLDNNRGWKAGKLNGRHGHEFYGSGGVFPARSYYLKAKDNILVSHVHQTSEYTTPDIGKALHAGFSIGCLSNLDPDYNPNNNYNHGFAFLEMLDKGNFKVENKRIINGEVL
jgi:predicted phosphodiesterase